MPGGSPRFGLPGMAADGAGAEVEITAAGEIAEGRRDALLVPFPLQDGEIKREIKDIQWVYDFLI